MKKNRFLILLLSALSIIILAACGSKDIKDTKDAKPVDGTSKNTSEEKYAIDVIKENGKIRVAVFSDKPPFGYVDSNGENKGYDVLLAKRIAKDLLGDESKVEYVLTEPQARVDLLKSDKVDLVLANFTVTPERSEQVDFANPYMKVAIGIASSNDALIKSIDDLKGKKVIVIKGTTAESYLMKDHPELELVKYDQNTEAFEALKDGRAAAIAHDNALLFGWANENEGFTVGVKTLGQLDYIAPAVQKGNKELLDWLNTELETLGSEQFFHKAYEETLKPSFGQDIDADDVVVEGKAE